MCESIPASRQSDSASSGVGCQRFGGGGGVRAKRMPGFKVLQVSKVQVPHYFRCPISLDLMRDPVTVATGQTYDRASIEKWVADGNTTCPATMQRLNDLTLIPNHTLRRLIQEWCVANRARGVERIPTPKQPVDPRRIEELLRAVEELASPAETIRCLRSLAKESDKNRAGLAEAGAARVMVAAMSRAAGEDGDEVVEEAIGVLALLPLADDERRTLTLAMTTVSRVLNRGGSLESRIAAAAVVEKLAAGGDEGIRAALGSTEGVMTGLVALLRDGGGSGKAAKASVRALFSLCLCASARNCEAAVAAGAAAPLVEHLPGAASSDAERTLGALELLCRTRAGREAVGGHALAVPALVGAILRGASFQATECAAGTLLAICSASAAVQAAAVQCGIVAQLLLLIQSGCTERAKRKAMELLKLLRGAWADDPCLLSELERTDVAAF